MSEIVVDQTTDTATADVANDTPEPAPDTTTPTDTIPAPEVGAPDKGNREAAKYRRQLRDAEAERDNARTELDSVRSDLADARNELLKSALRKYVVQTETQMPDGGSRTTYQTFNSDAIADAGISHDVFDGVNVNPERIDTAMRELAKSKPYMFTGGQTKSTLGAAESARLTNLVNDAATPTGKWEKAFTPNG